MSIDKKPSLRRGVQWFKKNWTEKPLFSTGFALLVMIVFQTLALGFNFDSFGEWFLTWCQN